MAKVRANWLKLVVGQAKRQAPYPRDAFFEALGSETRREIREMGKLAWVEAEYFHRLAAAIFEGMGPEPGTEFWRAAMADSLGRPLLRPLREGALGMFGKSPASLFRFSKQAWSLVTRELCTVRFQERGDDDELDGGCVTFGEIVPVLAPAEFSLFCKGASQAVVDVLRFEGAASLCEVSAAARRVRVEVTWLSERSGGHRIVKTGD